jgi:hypothetical protein
MRTFVKGIVLAAVIGGAALGVGCGKKSATCEAAVDNAMKIMMNSDEFKNAPADQKKMMEGMIKGLKDEAVKTCKDKKVPAADLQCLVDAKDEASLKKCKGDWMK